MKCMSRDCSDEAVKYGFCIKHAYVEGPDLETYSDPPVGTGGSGGAKSVPSQEEDVSGFEDPVQSDPPVGTGGSGGVTSPPDSTGGSGS